MDPYNGGNGMDPNRLKHIEDHVAKLHPSPTAETRYKDKQGLAKYVELLDKNTQVKPSTPPRQTDGDSTSFGAALKRIKTT